jgi:hypothetical protein
MGKLSNTYANLTLDIAFGKATNTFPAIFYVGLSSTEPTDTGTNVTEPAGGSGYARVGVTNSATYWSAAVSRVKANAQNVTFAVATADWASGSDLTHFVIYDAISGGNFVGWGALDNPAPVLTGVQAAFAPGALTITMPGT